MTVTVALTCIAIFVFTYFVFMKSRKKRNFPPGPDGIPIFGNVLQFERRQFMLNMADLGRKYGDAFSIKLFFEDVVVLNSYEMIKNALCSAQYAQSMSGRPPSFVATHVLKHDVLFATYSEEWSALRKLTIRGLKMYGTHLSDVEDLVQRELGYLLPRIQNEAGKAVDPDVYITGYITSILAMLVTGEHMKHDDKRLQQVTKIIDGIDYFLNPGTTQLITSLPWLRHIPLGPGSRYQQLKQDMLLMKKNIFDERKNHRTDSKRKNCFIDFIIEEKDKGYLAEENVTGVMMDLLVAGTATSRLSLYNMFLILAARPDVQKKIQQEIDEVIGRSRLPCSDDKNSMPYTQAVLWETFRLYPPTPMTTPRYTVEDVKIGDYHLPKDTIVFYNIWYVLHDEKFWNNPWEFHPSRFLDINNNLVPPENERRQRMIAFGVGKRNCIGEVLARLRIFLAFVAVLQNFNLTPDPHQPLPNTDPRTFDVSSLLSAPRYKIIFQPRELL